MFPPTGQDHVGGTHSRPALPPLANRQAGKIVRKSDNPAACDNERS